MQQFMVRGSSKKYTTQKQGGRGEEHIDTSTAISLSLSPNQTEQHHGGHHPIKYNINCSRTLCLITEHGSNKQATATKHIRRPPLYFT